VQARGLLAGRWSTARLQRGSLPLSSYSSDTAKATSQARAASGCAAGTGQSRSFRYCAYAAGQAVALVSPSAFRSSILYSRICSNTCDTAQKLVAMGLEAARCCRQVRPNWRCSDLLLRAALPRLQVLQPHNQLAQALLIRPGLPCVWALQSLELQRNKACHRRGCCCWKRAQANCREVADAGAAAFLEACVRAICLTSFTDVWLELGYVAVGLACACRVMHSRHWRAVALHFASSVREAPPTATGAANNNGRNKQKGFLPTLTSAWGLVLLPVNGLCRNNTNDTTTDKRTNINQSKECTSYRTLTRGHNATCATRRVLLGTAPWDKHGR
jgi:hypothetical protein